VGIAPVPPARQDVVIWRPEAAAPRALSTP
jgi:hypothetical protein